MSQQQHKVVGHCLSCKQCLWFLLQCDPSCRKEQKAQKHKCLTDGLWTNFHWKPRVLLPHGLWMCASCRTRVRSMGHVVISAEKKLSILQVFKAPREAASTDSVMQMISNCNSDALSWSGKALANTCVVSASTAIMIIESQSCIFCVCEFHHMICISA